MSNPAINTQAILDYYRPDFMKVFVDVCGDEKTYPQLAQSLEEPLSMAMRSSDPVMREYASGLANMTLDGESAGAFLRSYLNDGFNCPPGSATKESIGMMYTEVSTAGREIGPVAKAAGEAKNANALLDAWQQFRQIYFGRSDYLDRFIMGLGSSSSPLQHRQHSNPLNQARVNQIYGYASALHMIAPQVFAHALSGASRLRDNHASAETIRAQLIIMKLLHGHVLRIKEGIDQSSGADRKPILDQLSGFRNFWKFISNPLNWLTKLVSEMHKSIGDFVEVKLDEHSPNITHDRFHLVANLIDRIIIAAVNNKEKVTFYWDPGKNTLVAESRSFRTLSKDVAFVQLTGKLNARWDLNAGWRKLYERVSRNAETGDRIIVPLQMDGSTPSAPPPVEPSPAPSGDSNPPAASSGSDQNSAPHAQNAAPSGSAYAPTQLQIMGPIAAPAQVTTMAALSVFNVAPAPLIKIGL